MLVYALVSIEIWDLICLPPSTSCTPHLQSTCQFIENLYILKMAYVSGGYTKGKTLKYDFDALLSRVDNKF